MAYVIINKKRYEATWHMLCGTYDSIEEAGEDIERKFLPVDLDMHRQISYEILEVSE